MLAFRPCIDISSIAPLEQTRAHGWQGGGLFMSGTATLTNTNVYSNQADEVCSPLLPPVPRSFFQRPDGTLRAPLFGRLAGE